MITGVLFTDRSGGKRRPVVVISNDDYHSSCADAIIVPLTSNIDASLSVGDYRILEWKEAGLAMPSVAKGKPTTIPRSALQERLGTLTGDALRGVLARVKAILG